MFSCPPFDAQTQKDPKNMTEAKQLIDYPYTKAGVQSVANEVDFYDEETWNCCCNNEDGMSGTKGNCWPCVLEEHLCWVCGKVTEDGTDHEDDCDFDEEKHNPLNWAELVDKGLLTAPRWSSKHPNHDGSHFGTLGHSFEQSFLTAFKEAKAAREAEVKAKEPKAKDEKASAKKKGTKRGREEEPDLIVAMKHNGDTLKFRLRPKNVGQIDAGDLSCIGCRLQPRLTIPSMTDEKVVSALEHYLGVLFQNEQFDTCRDSKHVRMDVDNGSTDEEHDDVMEAVVEKLKVRADRLFKEATGKRRRLIEDAPTLSVDTAPEAEDLKPAAASGADGDL
jgi:hypothetical protein